MARRLLTVLALIAVGALLGCGSGQGGDSSSAALPKQTNGEQSIERYGQEAKGTERQQLLALYRSYLTALGEKDYESACAKLAAQVKGSLAQIAGPKADCEEILPAILSPTATPLSRAQSKGKVTGVRVEADHAFVVFKAPGAKLWQMTLLHEGGEWKVASLGAAVLVPDL